MSPSRHVVPDQVLTAPEPLSEAERLARVPSTPFAFIRFLVVKHFRARVALLVALAGTATSIEAFGPYAFVASDQRHHRSGAGACEFFHRDPAMADAAGGDLARLDNRVPDL
jgi:hypothetical protein